jgi:radical SAM superfamily enzyme YgiQ (UPF0313 family)
MPAGLQILAELAKSKCRVSVYEPRIRLIKASDYRIAALDILKQKPFLIGFSTWCISYPASILVARELKKAAPQIPVIFGGPQASILPVETLTAFPFIDFILSGEADFSFPLFLDEFLKNTPDFSKVPGLTYRVNNDTIQQSHVKEQITNPDELPIPLVKLIPKNRIIKLDVGRGCPFQCTFCTTNDFFSKKYRLKSTGRIIDEMMTYYLKWGIKSFAFIHDMFTFNKKTISDLCKRLIEIQNTQELFFTWSCSARTDCITGELLSDMKNAGCNAIFFGIESGSEKIQKSIRKNLKIENVYEIADQCRELGIKMFASFIIGFPDETKADIEKTLKCIFKLAINGVFVQVSELSLLPGTPLYNTYKEKLRLDGNFSNFSKTICGGEEIKLIKDYPHLFSSFYYLPIKSLNREKIVFINQIINKISLFKNSLMIISDNLEKNTEAINLLKLIENEFDRINFSKKAQIPIVSQLIRIITAYIQEEKLETEKPYLMSVFNYESYQALLKTLYSGWQHFRTKPGDTKLSSKCYINPTPVWKTLTIPFNAEKLIVNLNNLNRLNFKIRAGRYHFLLVATSEKSCNKLRINEKELILLNKLSEVSVSVYAEDVKSVICGKELILWLKKIKRLGVITIQQP